MSPASTAAAYSCCSTSLFLIIMGVPVLTMELAVGRASRKSAVLGYKALEPKGSTLAHPRLALRHRLLPSDDVLHHGLRLDAGLLLQIRLRHLQRHAAL